MENTVLAIIQARVSSSRLPGKVLKEILGQPMLLRQIERVDASKYINKIVVATSLDKTDDDIEKLCFKNGIDCFRGSLENVLERFYQCAKKYNTADIVRITGDCPLIDATVIDSVIDFYLTNKYDYVSNCINPTFPDGLDVEVFKAETLNRAYQSAFLPSEKEHVTTYIYKNPELFNIGHYKNSEDYSHLRWTVDEPEDFDFVFRIYELLYPINTHFTMNDILELLEKKPDLSFINSKFQRNEGLKKSITKDTEFCKGS